MKKTLLLTTILLTLGIHGQSAEPLDQLEKERQAIAALKKQIKQLEATANSRKAPQGKQAIAALQREVAIAKSKVVELEKENKGLRDQLDSNPLAVMGEDEKKKYVDRLMDEIQQLEDQVRNDVRVIPEESGTRLKPVLISISGTPSEISMGEFNEKPSTTAFNRNTFIRDLDRGLRQYDPKTHYFVFFFKPSACVAIADVRVGGQMSQMSIFDVSTLHAANLGFKFGYEPIHEEAVLIFTNRKGKPRGESSKQLALKEARAERKELERILKQLQADDQQAKRDGFEQVELRDELEKLDKEALRLREDIARFETILEHEALQKKLEQLPFRKISLPIEKATTARKINVIIANGKIYPTMQLVRGRASFDATHLQWATDEKKHRIASPNPRQGWHLEKNKDAVSAFLKSFHDSANQFGKKHFLEMIVFADSQSFSTFNDFRDQASLLEIGYNWKPITTLPVVFGVTSDAGVIQN